MIDFAQFLADLANPQLSFLVRAVIISVISAIVCAVVGCFVVLRGMAFIGDAISHAVFPGITIAFALQFSVLAGGAVAGAVVAVLIAAFSQKKNLREDSIIGIFFAAAFALGMVIISRVQGYTASLSNFLFGSLTGVSTADVTLSLIVAVIVVAVIVAVLPQLVACCLDRETARAMGLPVLMLDMVLYLSVTAAVVISVSTIGNILVLALLITPAATARLVTSNLRMMMVIAPMIGALGSFFGIYLAWAIDLPAGATIVLVLTGLFLLVWLFSGKRGWAVALVGVFTVAAAPAASAAITHGHQDLAVLAHGDVGIIDDVSGTTLSTATFAVNKVRAVPDELGGGEGYVLPQAQEPDQPWVGFSTTEYSMSPGDVVRIRMNSKGPGRVLAWQSTGISGYATIFDSDRDLHWDLPPHTHAHTGFIFTEPGTYSVTFSYELPTGAVKDLVVTFAVGPASAVGADDASEKEDASDHQADRLKKEFTDFNTALGGLSGATITALNQAAQNLKDYDAAKSPTAASTPTSTAVPARPAPAPATVTTTVQQPASPGARAVPAAKAPKTVTTTKKAPSEVPAAQSSEPAAPNITQAAPVEPRSRTTEVAAIEKTAGTSTMDFVAGLIAGVGGFAFIAGLGLLGYAQRRKREEKAYA